MSDAYIQIQIPPLDLDLLQTPCQKVGANVVISFTWKASEKKKTQVTLDCIQKNSSSSLDNGFSVCTHFTASNYFVLFLIFSFTLFLLWFSKNPYSYL